MEEFGIDKEYSTRYGIHTTYFKCAISSECNFTFKTVEDPPDLRDELIEKQKKVEKGSTEAKRAPTDTARLCASLLRNKKLIKSDFIHVI